jgi:hypothetical protein
LCYGCHLSRDLFAQAALMGIVGFGAAGSVEQAVARAFDYAEQALQRRRNGQS